MRDFLETLRQGMQEAQRRLAASQQRLTLVQAEFQTAQQKFTAAQSEFQVAVQEFNAYQTLVGAETRKQGQPAGPAIQPANIVNVPVRVLPAQAAVPVSAPKVVASNPATVPALASTPAPAPLDENKSEGNKTEAVRVLLRQHPAGMTPAEMWEQLKAQLTNRIYLYSVLKRLKDRGDVRERRGKYFFNSKVEEPQTQEIAL
jgi:hypothetical protein